jgi:hypothetical protein
MIFLKLLIIKKLKRQNSFEDIWKSFSQSGLKSNCSNCSTTGNRNWDYASVRSVCKTKQFIYFSSQHLFFEPAVLRNKSYGKVK